MYFFRRATRHTVQAVLEGLLIAAMAIALIAGTAFAARGGNHATKNGSGTIAVVYMDGATEATFGSRVTFAISTTATDYPFVHLRCYQAGLLVLDGWQGFFPTALGNEWFYLGPTPAWSSGSASCTADLDKSTKRGWSVLASTSFDVAP